MTDLKVPSAETSALSWTPGKILIVLLFAAAVGAFLYFDLHRYLSLESLKANRDRLLAFAEQRYTTTVVLFVVSYCLFVATNLPGAVFFTLAGGMLFGAVLGTVYVNVAATTGSTLAFLASRYLLHDWVERKFGGWLRPFQVGFKQNAFTYLLTIRLIPIFPFFIVNLLCGLTRISLGTFVASTAIGIIPGTFVYAYAGQQLGRINSLQEIASPRVLLAFTLLGVLALVPLLYRRFAVKRSRT